MNHAGGAAAEGRAARNGLMVAFAFTLPYHVMRTAAAAGLRVHVLGSGASRGLRTSRHCRSYHELDAEHHGEALLAAIAEIARARRVDVIFPSDDVSTRLLAQLRDRLPVACTPLPPPAVFDLLNDKWRFTQFCRANGVRAPQAWLFDDKDGLRAALATGAVDLPITVKPTNRSGGFGVMHIREPEEIGSLDAVDYRPVLVQRHIVGESVSITAMTDRGRVVADVVQQRDSRRFRLFADPDLLANVTRLVALTECHGPVNFDAVRAEDGLSYLVECNPRFWYSIYLVMLAGLNFVDLALGSATPGAGATLASGEMRLSLREILSHPWRAGRLDWKYLAYNLGDPLAYWAQRAKSYDDSEVAVPVWQMGAAATAARAPAS